MMSDAVDSIQFRASIEHVSHVAVPTDEPPPYQGTSAVAAASISPPPGPPPPYADHASTRCRRTLPNESLPPPYSFLFDSVNSLQYVVNTGCPDENRSTGGRRVSESVRHVSWFDIVSQRHSPAIVTQPNGISDRIPAFSTTVTDEAEERIRCDWGKLARYAFLAVVCFFNFPFAAIHGCLLSKANMRCGRTEAVAQRYFIAAYVIGVLGILVSVAIICTLVILRPFP